MYMYILLRDIYKVSNDINMSGTKIIHPALRFAIDLQNPHTGIIVLRLLIGTYTND